MSVALNVRVIEVLGRRSIKQAFRRPQFLAPVLLFPSLFLAANTGGAASATELPGFPEVNGFLDFELAAAMLQSALLAGVSGGIALALDVEMGFLDRLVAAPIPRWAMVVGRLAATGALGVLGGVWFLAIGLIFGATIESGVLGSLLIVVLSALAAAAFGGFGAALALWSGRASVVQGIFPLVFVILFLSSAFFPSELMLEPAGTLAELNPLSFIAEGLRSLVTGGFEAGPLLACLAAIVGLGALSAVLGALALRSRLRGAT